MDNTRISAIEILGTSLSVLWREKTVLFLLVAFLTIVSLIFIWPAVDWYTAVLSQLTSGIPRDTNELNRLSEEFISSGLLGYLFILSIPMILIQYGVLAIWSRVSVLGRAHALDGGFGAVVKRALWSFWRYICSIGWMILIMIAFWIILAVIFLILGAGFMASANGQISPDIGGGVFLVILPVYLVFIYIMLGLVLLTTVSIHGEARDVRLPIYKSFGYMKGNLNRAVGVMILALMVIYIFMILLFLLMAATLQSGVDIFTVLFLFIMFFIGACLNFFMYTYGALYAAEAVPELRG